MLIVRRGSSTRFRFQIEISFSTFFKDLKDNGEGSKSTAEAEPPVTTTAPNLNENRAPTDAAPWLIKNGNESEALSPSTNDKSHSKTASVNLSSSRSLAGLVGKLTKKYIDANKAQLTPANANVPLSFSASAAPNLNLSESPVSLAQLLKKTTNASEALSSHANAKAPPSITVSASTATPSSSRTFAAIAQMIKKNDDEAGATSSRSAAILKGAISPTSTTSGQPESLRDALRGLSSRSSSSSSGAMSLRQSLRQLEDDRRQETKIGERNVVLGQIDDEPRSGRKKDRDSDTSVDIDEAVIRGDPKAVREEILRGISGVGDFLGPADVVGPGARELKQGGGLSGTETEEEMTEGELRYLRHQEHLKRKREGFQARIQGLDPKKPWLRRGVAGTSDNQKLIDYRNSNNNYSGPQQSMQRPYGVEYEIIGGADAAADANIQSGMTAQARFEGKSNVSATDSMSISDIRRLTQERLSNAGTHWSSQGKNRQNRQQQSQLQELQRLQQQKQKRTTLVKEVVVPAEGLSIRDLASKLSIKTQDLRTTLTALGEDGGGTGEGAGIDKILDADVVELVVLEMGVEVKRLSPKLDIAMMSKVLSSGIGAVDGHVQALPLLPRAPVVCIMGHVDHGKTTLLDSLRSANVAASEAGGITQKLSAFTIAVNDKQVVFLDTPGHAAFSAMRSHGASATDVVVLVVAIDDGVRPQTIEALKTAQEAGCTIVVALNKIDKLQHGSERKAARSRVLAQLVDLNLVAEDFGGDTMVVEVAGRTGEGLDSLVEILALQSEILELTAPVEGPAEAAILDANMEKGRGVVAEVLMRWGKLSVGDCVVAGTSYGRVKALIDSSGNSVKSIGPSTPARLLGLRSVPLAGQELIGVPTESKARLIAERRQRVHELRTQRLKEDSSHMTNRKANNSAGTVDENGVPIGAAPSNVYVNVILKADGIGTLRALETVVSGLIRRITAGDVIVSVVSSSVGNISMNDVERAGIDTNSGGSSVILGFNVGIADSNTRSEAKEMDIQIVRDTVIYRLEDELKSTINKIVPMERYLVQEGLAKVLQVFKINDKSGVVVAGLNVESGNMRTSSSTAKYVYRVTRPASGPAAPALMEEDEAQRLKRFKDSVTHVEQGNECGLALNKFKDFAEGDVVECLKVQWRPRNIWISESSETKSLDANNSTSKN